MIRSHRFVRAIILSFALTLVHSTATPAQELVYAITSSVFPPQFASPSAITSFTVPIALENPTVTPVATLAVTAASGMILGPDGFLYVSSRNTNEILRVNTTSGATTAYANLTPGTTGGPTVAPAGLAFVGNTLYVSRFVGLQAAPDSGALDRYTFTSTGNVPGSPVYASTVVSNQTQPAGITVAPVGSPFAGSLFISSVGYSNFGNGSGGTPGQVTRYDPSTGISSVFIANATTPEGNAAGTNLFSASAAKFGPDGFLYVVDTIGNTVRKYDSVTGAFLSNFITAQLDFPSDIVFDSTGKAWVANLGNEQVGRSGSINRYDLNGAYIDTVANSGYYAQLAIQPIPEPASILGICALAGVALRLRKRRSK